MYVNVGFLGDGNEESEHKAQQANVCSSVDCFPFSPVARFYHRHLHRHRYSNACGGDHGKLKIAMKVQI